MTDGGGGECNPCSVSSPSVTFGDTSPWRGRIVRFLVLDDPGLAGLWRTEAVCRDARARQRRKGVLRWFADTLERPPVARANRARPHGRRCARGSGRCRAPSRSVAAVPECPHRGPVEVIAVVVAEQGEVDLRQVLRADAMGLREPRAKSGRRLHLVAEQRDRALLLFAATALHAVGVDEACPVAAIPRGMVSTDGAAQPASSARASSAEHERIMAR